MRLIVTAVLICFAAVFPAYASAWIENRPDGQYVVSELTDDLGHVYAMKEQKLDPSIGTVLCALPDPE